MTGEIGMSPMHDAVRYLADRIRAESLERQASAALDAGDLVAYRRLSFESAQLANNAETLRKDTILRARKQEIEGR
jgi:hypothetical protein